ncbi:HB1, ASXL, restriction endonuclease HTH domain [Methylobacterium sp. 174MFSha1.1]|uniref:winged helix-turn-helix domain-containing protein n=1 Tax=Methylobacterium sp. 174MFSha1.1 TaxID=1502749 RepID=UPI0008EEE0CF|nr:winged helix-turn-helix domain-containing protein [Methylobacterium sp. 174MFSha1.1]SFU41238.1 HB1, ASXL, restriction endonuclease HTH domain [Methylobacterium sp. 174MFSha1.1]
MFLSEAETESRLDDLRRQRAALDRAIAEHELYLGLGRRLARPAAEPARTAPAEPPRPDPAPRVSPETPRAEPVSPPVAEPVSVPTRPQAESPAGATARQDGRQDSRQEGRRLMAAAEEILTESGRPMHAAEIWEQLAARGLTLPGHDPVAALNTRLWKRAQAGTVFRRLGDAVYGLAS